MATIRQKDSGSWQAIVRRRGWPQQSKTFRTKTEALQWSKGIETEINRGSFQSYNQAERTVFKDLLTRFKNDFAPFHYRERSDKKEAWRFQSDRLEDFFSDYSISAIDPPLIARYRDERLRPPAGSNRPAVQGSTVRKEIYLLSRIFEFAISECHIPLPHGNPVEGVRKPVENESRDRRLSREEWTVLDAECKRSRNPLLHMAFIFATETAMRQEELLTLTRENIDEHRKIAFLPHTKNGEARYVPLTNLALKIVKELPHSGNSRIFAMERLTLYHAFNAAVKRASITDYTWHDLRHEALSRLAERGDLSLLEIASIGGHKTLQMVKRYTHLEASKIADKLNPTNETKEPSPPETQELMALIKERGMSVEELKTFLASK
ncbi:MAG: site-specific integrase [Ferribacterium limneticum]